MEGAPPGKLDSPTVAGWYDDPKAPGVRRYWDGTGWTDSRVTTEGLAYREPEPGQVREGPSAVALFFSAVLIIGGAICLWIAQNYKPTLSNQLGLNGNSHVLSSGGYHALMVAGIIFLVAGVLRLLLALLG